MAVYEQLVKAVLDEMYLEDLTEENISGDEALFGEEGLGLDSLDAVELVVLVEKHFDVIIENVEADRWAFGSLKQMAAFIEERRG